MKIGVGYPTIELNGDPAAIREIGRAAEDLNYDHIVMWDHVIGIPLENRNPPFRQFVSDKYPFNEPLMSIAYLAGITQRINFMIGVMKLPQRQTILVAKQMADLSLLSSGRVRLGVGTGWNYVEYQALGVDWSQRDKILDEQIPYLRRLWTEELVSIDGKFHQLDRGAIHPRPRKPIPIYVGGDSEVAFRRAAQLGDGFIFGGPVEQCLEGLSRMRELLAEQQRAVDGFATHFLMFPAGVDPRGGGKPGDVGRNAQSIVDDLRRWRDAGGTTATIATTGLGFKSVQQHIGLMADISHRLGL
jgi:probable F420-dependent oxidoreductase